MMKMATGDGYPLRQGAGTGSRLVFGGYRGLRRRNPDLGFYSGVSIFIGSFGVGGKSGGSTRLFWSVSDAPWASSGP